MSGEDHAHGEVFMIPSGSRQAYRAWAQPKATRATVAELLAIRFVAVENGRVSGMLEPYRDPECDCRAVSRFNGQLRGGIVEGTFTTTTSATNVPSLGTWSVRRKRS